MFLVIIGAQLFGECTHANPELNIRAQKGFCTEFMFIMCSIAYRSLELNF